jgi:hypothetical protein
LVRRAVLFGFVLIILGKLCEYIDFVIFCGGVYYGMEQFEEKCIEKSFAACGAYGAAAAAFRLLGQSGFDACRGFEER